VGYQEMKLWVSYKSWGYWPPDRVQKTPRNNGHTNEDRPVSSATIV